MGKGGHSSPRNKPSGTTLGATDLLKTRDTVSTVVLVSDGIETCGGDPCAAVGAAKQAGVRLVLHVVGFDVGNVNVSKLECAAQAGGGLYFDARNAEDLADALDQVLEAPAADQPTAALAVGATDAGKPIDATVTVTPAGDTERVAHGRTYTGPETNPRVFPVDPGMYDVTVTHLGMKGDAKRVYEDVEVREGERTEITADFSSGKISIETTRNGALEDCTVTVYRSGTKEQVAAGRTYVSETSNPLVLDVSPGTYDVSVGSIRLKGASPQRFDGLEVRAGETTARAVDFTAGELAVGITRNGKLSDATVAVYRPGTDEQVASGRTYTSDNSNPKLLELIAGTYDVRVLTLEVEGVAAVEFTGVEVRPSDRAERPHDFANGTLRVSATSEGEG